MIYFKILKYKNILSTGNNFISLDLTQCNTNLCQGLNGHGKSTILDAITFTLYGKPFRKINKPQLINSVNNSDLLCEITFDILDKSYLIKRGMKPNIFEIYENDILLNQDAATRDYQEFLENNILKMSYKTFTQIVVIGNATYMPFMKLSPNDRRQIVENLLDIDIFSKMNSVLKTQMSQTKENISDISYKVDLSKEKMKIYNNMFVEGNSSLDKQIAENESEIVRNSLHLEKKKEIVNNLQEQISGYIINDNKISSLTDKITKLTKYGLTFKEKIKNIKKEISFFKDNESCPTCTQVIPSSFKENSLSQKEQDHNKLAQILSSCEDQIQNIKKELDVLVEQSQEIAEKNAIIKERTFEINSIQDYINKISAQNVSLLEQKIQDITKAKEEYNSLQKEHDNLIHQRDLLLQKQHISSIAAILLKDDGIKTKIIRHYLPIMNKIINKYLHMMDFYISFSLDESFNEIIKNKAKESFTYHSFSEGEKLRIDLAILFTWREIAKMKNAANTNILILDEIFDSSLDASGIDEFLKILSSNKEHTNTFVISHKTEFLVDKFERTYKFYKVNGFTKVAID